MQENPNNGVVNITSDAIASLTGALVAECYGVVGMASKKFFRDNVAILLRKHNYGKGVVVKKDKDSLSLDIYIIVCYGVKISEVVSEVQKKVYYELSKTLDMEIKAINVFVQGVKVVN